MKKQLLNSINNKLYEVESAVEANRQEFINYEIKNIDRFLKIINLYISSFYLLEKFENENLLNLLDKQLENILRSYEHINLYIPKIKSSITFIEKHVDTFFPLKTVSVANKTKLKKEITTINTIEVNNFFSIKNLKLNNLKDKKEIYILGENGDGKTLLLQAIAIGLAGVKEGDVFDLVKSQEEATITIEDSAENSFSKESNHYEHIFAYGASRNNSCQMKEDKVGYLTLFENRYDLRSPVEWLIYLDHNEKSGKPNIISVVEAKKLLNRLLNSDIEIEITPDEVIFKEKGSTVSFEQLSAGYKGVVTIICDMIARLYEKQPYVVEIKDFQGVVLIDEVELHLHPKWKYDFMKKLRDTFPLIQFIVTTHSPTVMLGASKEAVFYKIYKEDGEVQISNQIKNEGYTNNSLLSSPLFDMERIASRDYDRAVSSDDYIYEKIHQRVAKMIKDDINVNEEELLKLIDEELNKI